MATAPGVPTESIESVDFHQKIVSSLTDFVDHWIYVFMASLLVITTLTGFIPDSLAKLAMIEAGQRPPFPPVLHVHAVLMGSWLMLLLTQTTLVATGRRGWHRQLGLVSIVLAPAVVLTGFFLIPTMHAQLWAAFHAAPPEQAQQIAKTLEFSANILLYQIRSGTMFAALVILALRARKHNSGLHKRLMVLAAAVPMAAATDRILWLPTTLPDGALTVELWPLALLFPMFAWDLFRLRRIHAAYIIYFAMALPFVIATHLLWGTPWWQDFVPRMLGFA